jgi:hypothetical protein
LLCRAAPQSRAYYTAIPVSITSDILKRRNFVLTSFAPTMDFGNQPLFDGVVALSLLV